MLTLMDKNKNDQQKKKRDLWKEVKILKRFELMTFGQN